MRSLLLSGFRCWRVSVEANCAAATAASAASQRSGQFRNVLGTLGQSSAAHFTHSERHPSRAKSHDCKGPRVLLDCAPLTGSPMAGNQRYYLSVDDVRQARGAEPSLSFAGDSPDALGAALQD